jgi:hypothetical protein
MPDCSLKALDVKGCNGGTGGDSKPHTSNLLLISLLHFHLASLSLANTFPESKIAVRIKSYEHT